jgi:hypothetical protein
MQIQAIGSRIGKAGRLLEANRGWFIANLRNAMLFLGIFGIGFLFIAKSKFGMGPFENVVVPSILVILGSLMMIGKRALTITSFDYFFVGFILLSITSHLFANEYLFRHLGTGELFGNFRYILTMAVLFRAFFCLVYIAPKFASQMFAVSSLLILGGIAALGIMQRFGPGKPLAVKIGMALTANSLQVLEASKGDRPTAVFTNPNILGYAMCALCAIVLGWGLCRVEQIKPWRTAAVVTLLGMALLCAVACQSRQATGALIFAPAVFAIVVRLKARDGLNLAVIGVLFAVAGVGLVLAVSSSKSTYLTSIATSGVKHDQSYQARTAELNKLRQVTSEIALGGEGTSMSNMNAFSMASEHSHYNTYEIDSEWGNIFQAFGVWGPLLLCIFYLLTVFNVRQVWLIDDPDAKMIALASAMMLGFNLILTTAAVRVAKYESAGFTFEMLGALAAWRVYGLERGLIRAKPRLRTQVARA